MQERIRRCVYIVFLSVAAAAFAGQDQAQPRQLQSVAPVLWQPSMNVFRRFSVSPQAMYDCYGKVLGLHASRSKPSGLTIRMVSPTILPRLP